MNRPCLWHGITDREAGERRPLPPVPGPAVAHFRYWIFRGAVNGFTPKASCTCAG
jgi:hypothetical protein